jgi:hypothetical protein
MQAQYYTSEDFLGRKNKFLLVSCHKWKENYNQLNIQTNQGEKKAN